MNQPRSSSKITFVHLQEHVAANNASNQVLTKTLTMENFTVYNPVRLKFGPGTVDTVGQDLAEEGHQSVLILLGQGSARRSGLLDRIEAQLLKAGLSWEIFEGIRPNPVYEDADRAVQRAKAMKADALLAVGGGSVIDTAKAVAAGAYVEHSVWDFY
ncbi:MAG: iron-containing alcohol dehydrogenase, partial [Sphingomonadales bacterium]|nr:iron-containing alcohol dehydrogenase [Sphingomonadales bacterium]